MTEFDIYGEALHDLSAQRDQLAMLAQEVIEAYWARPRFGFGVHASRELDAQVDKWRATLHRLQKAKPDIG